MKIGVESLRWLTQAKDEFQDADDLRKRGRFYLTLFHFQQAAKIVRLVHSEIGEHFFYGDQDSKGKFRTGRMYPTKIEKTAPRSLHLHS